MKGFTQNFVEELLQWNSESTGTLSRGIEISKITDEFRGGKNVFIQSK